MMAIYTFTAHKVDNLHASICNTMSDEISFNCDYIKASYTQIESFTNVSMQDFDRQKDPA